MGACKRSSFLTLYDEKRVRDPETGGFTTETEEVATVRAEVKYSAARDQRTGEVLGPSQTVEARVHPMTPGAALAYIDDGEQPFKVVHVDPPQPGKREKRLYLKRSKRDHSDEGEDNGTGEAS